VPLCSIYNGKTLIVPCVSRTHGVQHCFLQTTVPLTPPVGPPVGGVRINCPYIGAQVINGTCVIPGDLNITEVIFVIDANVTVLGNFTQGSNSTLSITYPSTLTIQGCANLGGTLQVNVNQSTSGTDALYYNCRTGQFETIIVTGGDECNEYTLANSTYQDTKLQLLFDAHANGACDEPSAGVEGLDPTTLGIAIGVSIGGSFNILSQWEMS